MEEQEVIMEEQQQEEVLNMTGVGFVHFTTPFSKLQLVQF